MPPKSEAASYYEQNNSGLEQAYPIIGGVYISWLCQTTKYIDIPLASLADNTLFTPKHSERLSSWSLSTIVFCRPIAMTDCRPVS